MPKGRSKRTGEIGALKGWQLAALREMMGNSTIYTQRVLEEVKFPTPDGQRWKRTLQLRIPNWDSFARGQSCPEGDLRFIVPLSVFIRARLPDFSVRDGHSHVCPLVTRTQHGYAMSMITLRQFIDPHQQRLLRTARAESEISVLGRRAMDALFAMFTTLPGDRRVAPGSKGGLKEPPSAAQLTERSVRALDALMKGLGMEEQDCEKASALYTKDFQELQQFTQYLCFVEARPGASMSLEITYTIGSSHELSPDKARKREADEKRRAPRSKSRGAGRLGVTLVQALRVRWAWRQLRAARIWWRHERTDLYARTGLGPANYEAFATATGRAGSFYFTIEPPPDTELSYLGWASGNSIEDKQEKLSWLCSLPSTHEHHGARLGAGMSDVLASDTDRALLPAPGRSNKESQDSGAPENTVLAFMRPLPRNQMQIALGAGMNLVLACLALSKRLNSELDPSAASLLLLTPAVLVAYIAYQRRHHYASTTKGLRATLWIYVLLDAIFLFSIVFDVTENSTGIGAVFNHRVSAVVLAGASAGLMVFFLLIGGRYEWLIRRKFLRRRNRIERRRTDRSRTQPRWVHESKARTFSRAATRSSDVVFCLSVAAAVVVMAGTVFFSSWLATLGLGGDVEPREQRNAPAQFKLLVKPSNGLAAMRKRGDPARCSAARVCRVRAG